MKKTATSIGLLFIILLSFSCKKFLNVSSENDILQEQLFSEGQGVRIAVNGVYRAISSTELYGKNLSWGLISGMGYNYEINSSLGLEIQNGANFNYKHASVEKVSNDIWKKAYNVIANCNNIIQEVEKKPDSFFELGNDEKQLIIGEMIGVRAMLHFDMMRLYSPSFASGYTGSSIPYVSVYPTKQPVHLNMNDAFNSIVADMSKSRSILAAIDTTKFARQWSSIQGRVKLLSNMTLEEGDFFNFRAQRMNYFATSILLARMYLYKGDYDQAYAISKHVYDLNRKKNWVRWTSSSYQGGITLVDFVYPKRPDELFLSGSNGKNLENWNTDTQNNSSSNQAYVMKNMNNLFQDDLDDYRYVAYYNRYNDGRYLIWARPQGTIADLVNQSIAQAPVIPMIRWSEVYHIMIESMIHLGLKNDAVPIFNTLRTNRGAKRKFDVSITTEALKAELIKDIIKETLTEGQTFFMFKRLNRNIYNGSADRVMNFNDWFFPMPTSEDMYQLN